MKSKLINQLFKSVLAISIALHTAGNVAHAQSDGADDTDQLEEIVVRGIRGSLTASSEIKRDAANIVDSIVAEDIGRFPDENVAESLQRIPGVSISRSGVGAEGGSVSIRGLGPDFTRVFVNGRSVLGTGLSRQVDFRGLPSEMISRMDVYKTPMASLIEGSIGGTVNIHTASPFDYGGGLRIVGSAEGVYNDLVDEWKPRISAGISNTFADGTIGALFGFQYQDRATRQDTFDVPGWVCVDVTLEVNCQGTLEDMPLEDRYFRPRFPRQFMRTLTSERLGFNGALHWRPSDNVNIEFDANYYTIDDVEDQNTVIVGTFPGASNLVPGSAVVNENNTVIALQADNAQLRSSTRIQEWDNENIVLGLKGEWVAGPWTFIADVGYSEGSNDHKHDQAQLFRLINGSWDYRTKSGIPIFDLGVFSDDPFSRTGWTVNNVRKQLNFTEQDETNLRVDIEREFDGGFFDSIQFGVRYTDGGVSRDAYGWFQNIRPRPSVEDNFDVNEVLATTAENSGVGNYGTDFPGGADVISNWILAPTFGGIMEFYLPDDPLTNTNWPGTYTIGEETTAAYVQANFSGDMGRFPFSGNIGVRYVQTDVRTTGGSTVPDFINLQEGEYSDTLPSLNFRLDLSDELLLRFAAASVMSRPSYGSLNPATSVNVTTFTGRTGNPSLEPWRADQFDLALEWYFGEGNILAATIFYKDVESFVQNETIFTTIPPELLAGVDPASIFAISRPGNGEGATVDGFEISYQQAFINLPSPWDGLGVLANYTKLDTDAEQINSVTGVKVGLEGLSENAYNITGYYEKYGFALRLAYTWRDTFLQAAQGGVGTPEFGNEFGQLDATVSYEFGEHVTFFIEAKNLNGEVYRAYEYLDERMRTYNAVGRRFFVGMRANF